MKPPRDEVEHSVASVAYGTKYYNAAGERWCFRAGHWSAEENFGKLSKWCAECRAAYRKEKYNPAQNKKRNREYSLRKKPIFNNLLYDQGGRCAICARSETEEATLTFFLDFDGDVPRGVLCQDCRGVFLALAKVPLSSQLVVKAINDYYEDYHEARGEKL